jgi:hypothetical protein
MFNPNIANLFHAIGRVKGFRKGTSIFFILFQYFALFCGGQFFIIITIFLLLSTILILILASEDGIVDNFWIFFTLGPGLVAFLIVVIIQLINVFNRRKEK